jgi:hypothetical protein
MGDSGGVRGGTGKARRSRIASPGLAEVGNTAAAGGGRGKDQWRLGMGRDRANRAETTNEHSANQMEAV